MENQMDIEDLHKYIISNLEGIINGVAATWRFDNNKQHDIYDEDPNKWMEIQKDWQLLMIHKKFILNTFKELDLKECKLYNYKSIIICNIFFSFYIILGIIKIEND